MECDPREQWASVAESAYSSNGEFGPQVNYGDRYGYRAQSVVYSGGLITAYLRIGGGLVKGTFGGSQRDAVRLWVTALIESQSSESDPVICHQEIAADRMKEAAKVLGWFDEAIAMHVVCGDAERLQRASERVRRLRSEFDAVISACEQVLKRRTHGGGVTW